MKHSSFSATGKPYLILASMVFVIAAMQFFNTSNSNPPVTGKIAAPIAVVGIFERACYDCHSNETKLEWFDKIAPVSWQVAADIKKARSRFNLSRWDTLSAQEQETTLWKMVNALIAGKMPLRSYSTFHANAKISNADIEVLKNYLGALQNNRPIDSLAAVASIVSAHIESVTYRIKKSGRDSFPVALNGVKYFTGYQKWQVINSTNRFDNYTIRIVYANAIAVKAIGQNKINPFPDGSAIVKVVWNKIEDGNGNTRPGTFNAVQVMIKDNNRFPDTGGWGFSIFNGLYLMPTGKTPNFASACFNCHKLFASDHGYVFNGPRAGELFDAGKQQVITSCANEKDKTVSILYGNQLAMRFALDISRHHRSGEQFTWVTWQQIDHPRWYGSQVNGTLQTIETVNIQAAADCSLQFLYTVKKLQQEKNNDKNTNSAERIRFILNRQPAVFPEKQ